MNTPLPDCTPPATSAPLTPGARSPLLAFWLDMLIGIGILLAISIGGGVIWAIVRGVGIALDARRRGVQLTSDQVTTLLGQPGVIAQLLITLAATGSAALVLYFWRRRAGVDERRSSAAAIRQPATWGWIVLVALAISVFSNVVSYLAHVMGIELAPTNLPLMEQAMSKAPVFLIAFAVFIAPAYEELLFRRVLFGRLAAAGRPWLGMLLSSLAFALLHEVPGVSGNGPAAIAQLWLVYGVMGAAFAWVYWRTGTLWASISAHAINNALALLLMHVAGPQ